ncbi:hypothetical protein [Pseudomonas sp. PDM25]|uniref:hypothetical protein n=1 Tax=Pseudomonas sp. PDM25 TaxID=2854772 RepID=UPI001C466567|nr:hypothetical protein [Pseudomonas sp. PDM25]MBV7515850.1 hypothetical protein [Pseudomonas sp. PDM25]
MPVLPIATERTVGGVITSADIVATTTGRIQTAYYQILGFDEVSGNTTVGRNSSAAGNSSVVVGDGAATIKLQSLAMGCGSHVASENGMACGYNAFVGESAQNAVAIGYKANATGMNSVAIGALSTTLDDLGSAMSEVVSVGSDKIQRRIVNLSPGSSDNDAVTLLQLNAKLEAQSQVMLALLTGELNSLRLECRELSERVKRLSIGKSD